MLGWESWIHQMFIKTVPASTPFRYHNLTFIQYNMDKKRIFSLRHSIYENETVVNDISDWIKGEKPVKYSTDMKFGEFI